MENQVEIGRQLRDVFVTVTQIHSLPEGTKQGQSMKLKERFFITLLMNQYFRKFHETPFDQACNSLSTLNLKYTDPLPEKLSWQEEISLFCPLDLHQLQHGLLPPYSLLHSRSNQVSLLLKHVLNPFSLRFPKLMKHLSLEQIICQLFGQWKGLVISNLDRTLNKTP